MGDVIKRDEEGKFPTGVSGNPKGRPKGSRNQITLLKESLELELRQQGASRMPEILEVAMELALQGDRTMLKLLLEMHLTKGGTGDVKAGQEKVTINIKGPDSPVQEVIEVVSPDDSSAPVGASIEVVDESSSELVQHAEAEFDVTPIPGEES